jgi:hypothetical protein
MADSLSPTYRIRDEAGTPHYVCLLCDHEATDADLFTLHMQQSHAGWMLREPPSEEPVPVPAPVPGEPTPTPEPVPDEEEPVPVSEEQGV